MRYYYLIATLPDLSLEETKSGIDFGETIETIRRNLEPEDEALLRYLLLRNDNKNLLGVIFHQYHQLPLPAMVQPCLFDEDTMVEFTHHPHDFPEYMADFITSFQERFADMGMAALENQLLLSFYQAVSVLNDNFIRDYFAFERDLRSIIAGLNRGVYEFSSGTEMVENERISERLSHEGAGASVLMKTYPFIESLKEVLDTKDPTQIEKAVDTIIWQYIDTANNGFFDRQQVYGYVLRLLMIRRWTMLEAQDGVQHFRQLSERVRSSSEKMKTKLI